MSTGRGRGAEEWISTLDVELCQNKAPFRRVTPGSRGPLRGSPWSVRGHLGLSELGIST
jgi:hypothetical protein